MTLIPSSVRDRAPSFLLRVADGLANVDPSEWRMVRDLSKPSVPETPSDLFVLYVLVGTCVPVVGCSLALIVMRFVS
ncbi:MAG: hypothetical protein JWN93_476 [Hyphomicrobiales bacterium]|nr:hypothetical protein [Hyphomicrobiales bacterium]